MKYKHVEFVKVDLHSVQCVDDEGDVCAEIGSRPGDSLVLETNWGLTLPQLREIIHFMETLEK